MSKKIRVGVLCGGESPEHEVSLQSAKNVVAALDKSKYEPVVIGIDKAGRWALFDATAWLAHEHDPKRIGLKESALSLAVAPGGGGRSGEALVGTSVQASIPNVDVVFPVLHGPNGEDGAIQGLLRLAHIPFVGADVLGSAIGMDKEIMKRLLRDAGLPIPNFLSFRVGQQQSALTYEKVAEILGSVVFVKPANMGSSVGVSRADDAGSFKAAVQEAFKFDDKILIEEAIVGREIECAVLGNEVKRASTVGEIIPSHDFYSYEAKYIDPDGAAVEIPAKIEPDIIKKVQELAIRTCEILCCDGMSRVDMFLKKDGTVLINEVNTIPGFTNISMYPKLWEASGLSYSALLDELISLALARYERKQQLVTANV